MVAIISQLGVGKIDRKRFQLDLGLPTIGAADVRLCRFKAKIAKAGAAILVSPGSSPAKPAKGANTSTPKKRKLEMDEDGNPIGHEDQDMFQMPVRKIPGRRARVTCFKEEGGEEEVQDSINEDTGTEAIEEFEHMMGEAEDGKDEWVGS